MDRAERSAAGAGEVGGLGAVRVDQHLAHIFEPARVEGLLTQRAEGDRAEGDGHALGFLGDVGDGDRDGGGYGWRSPRRGGGSMGGGKGASLVGGV